MSVASSRTAPWLAGLALLAGLAGPAAAGPDVRLTSFGAGAETQGTLSLAPSLAPSLAISAIAAEDRHGRPFVIVDKAAARVFAFDGSGALVGETAVLLGAARGDISPSGIGTMRLADITPAMRITPSGRYEAQLGVNLAGHRILWIDYDAALSLHAVITSNPKEHRLERLSTPSILDNRISYGCINVPARFYSDIVEPLFTPAGGVVYILPESNAADPRTLSPN